MIKVEEGLKIVLNSIKRLIGTEVILLTNGQERILAADICADSAMPEFDNSAMDGYALRASDTKGASRDRPRALEVIEDLRAGYVSKRTLKGGQAIRIMTGAPIPKGSDSVIMVEDTKKIKNQKSKIKNKEFVRIFKEVKPGENVRKAGEDIKKGETVIKKGARLRPSHIGILASLGRSRIKVALRPKVAILATGDEVIDIDKKMRPGKIRNSNTYTLYSQVIKCGGVPKNLGIAKDNPSQLEKKLKEGFGSDMILVSGGVSVGEYDFIKDVLVKLGVDIKFWQVAMRPGKPLVFGMLKNRPVFGLPGNPVSSMIGFEIFVKPAILKMLGQNDGAEKKVDAILEEDIAKKRGFRYFLRAHTHSRGGVYLTRLSGPQGSAMLKSMALANSLIILPEEEEFIKKGKKVTALFLE